MNNIKSNNSSSDKRTFIFKGWYNGKLIEETIKAIDRESAIAYIEKYYPNYNFPLIQELI